MRIYYDSRDIKCKEPFGAAETGGKVRFSVFVQDAEVREAQLQIRRDDEEAFRSIDMAEEKDAFTAELNVPDEPCLLWYRFRLVVCEDEKVSSVYYCNNAEATGGAGQLIESDGELIPYQITVYSRAEVPDWYKNGIVYQIFPDRFARDEDWQERCEEAVKLVNGRRSDVKRVIEDDWEKPAYYVRNPQNRVIEWPIYGGSLKGIEEKLDYLKSLGVTAIYLNPVFEATSNHRYDTGNYLKIDPALGTEDDFVHLAETAREKGIRLILDGVFSHTGADSIYFDRFGNYPGKKEPGAWGHVLSPYRSWYKFDESERCGYRSWWGVEDLPEVNEEDPGYKKFILGSDVDEGVVPHWIRLGASGWRLDVADELPDSFIRSARKAVKEADPEGLLIGEVWEDASNKISYGERRRYFAGDELDGTMHYPLRQILLDYVNYTISAGKAADRLMSLRENYPEENFYGALNLIGSHDRERILSMMACEQDRRSAVSKVKLLSVMQYTLPGVPCIYYGDEAGLAGGTDPENRSGFPWGKEDPGLEFHYRMLGLIYDEHPVLKDGDLTVLSGRKKMPDDIFAFMRTGEEKILVLVNRSYGAVDVDLGSFDELKGGYAIDLLTSEELGTLGKIKMDSLSAKVICILDEKPEREDLVRSAGVICHLSSLGKNSLGKPARDFVDFLAEAGFGVWQVLPLNPPGLGDSPYDSASAFAGDTRFINRDEIPDDEEYDEFCEDNAWWLRGYVAYTLIREMQGGKPWHEWPDELKMADPEGAFAMVYETLGMKEKADRLMHDQYLFYEQWAYLKEYANSRGVRIMGDIPMYMASDSADVWANKDVFLLDENGRLRVHAGVPPDYFSKEGQDWGNPLYDWTALEKTGYDWWMKRLRQCAERFDILRIDHFRGLSEYYAIPEGEKPVKGMWQHSAGLKFIKAAKDMIREEKLGMKLLAEDLGFLDAGVYDLLKLSGLPGMDIWQFTAREMMALDPETAVNRAFYTGTHDNETLIGFVKEHEEEIVGHEADEEEAEDAAEEIMRKIYESPASLAMVQLQDVFMLGNEARMNVPGVAEGNWSWAIPGKTVKDAFPDADERAEWFRKLSEETGRC